MGTEVMTRRDVIALGAVGIAALACRRGPGMSP